MHSVAGLSRHVTAPAPPATMWTKAPLSHLQLSRWLFFATPVQVNGHFGFWSILGVLSGIGALIIGITYLLCRFKKPTNQVADQDRGMLSDTFTQRTEIRTVLYSLNHAEYHCMQPTPLVQLQTRNETTTPPDTGPNATSSTATANTMSSLLQPQSSDRWSGYGSGDSVPTRDTVVTSVNATAVTPNTITTTDLKTENSRRNSSLKISLCRNSLFRKQDFEEVVV
ncbi:Hypothetical predicted protein [Octopus vulgaris]|uniref:Uncharacterized protein n=1 Tax=Octopus vulgaris TaxID=6645 RepID=A0AA36FIK9_OCTVU|nr:Hypothetical predicted protein [Octopus vulgaris]